MSVLFSLTILLLGQRERELLVYFIGPRRKKTCLRGFANNTGAEQPAHPRSLISPFVIRFLECTMCKLATEKNSIR